MQWLIGLGLAELEFIFPQPLPVLCFALAARKVLINTPEFWLLLSRAGTASALSQRYPHIKGLAVGKVLGGDTTRPSDPK